MIHGPSIVTELAAERPDALRQRFVSDWDTAPDFAHEAVLGDQPAGLANHQRQGIEIAAVQFDRLAAAAELTVGGVELESFEADASRHP